MSQFKNSELLEISGALTGMQHMLRLSPKLIYMVARNTQMVDRALEAYHLAKNALMERHAKADPAKPGKFEFETLAAARAFIAEDKGLQELYQNLDLEYVEFSEITAYMKAVENVPGEGITPAILAGLWPILNGKPEA